MAHPSLWWLMLKNQAASTNSAAHSHSFLLTVNYTQTSRIFQWYKGVLYTCCVSSTVMQWPDLLHLMPVFFLCCWFLHATWDHPDLASFKVKDQRWSAFWFWKDLPEELQLEKSSHHAHSYVHYHKAWSLPVLLFARLLFLSTSCWAQQIGYSKATWTLKVIKGVSGWVKFRQALPRFGSSRMLISLRQEIAGMCR